MVNNTKGIKKVFVGILIAAKVIMLANIDTKTLQIKHSIPFAKFGKHKAKTNKANPIIMIFKIIIDSRVGRNNEKRIHGEDLHKLLK
jgi:hypothetical protein